MVSGLAGNLTGFLFMILAPGNAVRASYITEQNSQQKQPDSGCYLGIAAIIGLHAAAQGRQISHDDHAAPQIIAGAGLPQHRLLKRYGSC